MMPVLPTILRQNLPEIMRLCVRYRVVRLWAFGSVLGHDFSAQSDIDLAYCQAANLPILQQGEDFWALKDALEELFGRKVDLVWYTGLQNPYFKAALDATKVLIYEQEGAQVSV